MEQPRNLEMHGLGIKLSPSSSIGDPPCQICGGRHQPPLTTLCQGCRTRYYRQCHTLRIIDNADLSWLCVGCMKSGEPSQCFTPELSSLSRSASQCSSLPNSKYARCVTCKKSLLGRPCGPIECKRCDIKRKEYLAIQARLVQKEEAKLQSQRSQARTIAKPLFRRKICAKIRTEKIPLISKVHCDNMKSTALMKLSGFLALGEDSEAKLPSLKRKHADLLLDSTAFLASAGPETMLGSSRDKEETENYNSYTRRSLSPFQTAKRQLVDGEVKMSSTKQSSQPFCTESRNMHMRMPSLSLEQRLADIALWGHIDPRTDWPKWPQVACDEEIDAVLEARRARNLQLSFQKFPIGGSRQS